MAIISVTEPRAASTQDFIALLKPRVMSLVVFTALAGMVVAPGHVHILTALTALICIAVGAGASGALNMAYDADIDRLMARTASRPVAMGRIAPDDANAFGIALSLFSIAIMGLFVNVLAAGLLFFTIAFYAAVYTMYLKRRTVQNIVIGGLAGALPPAIGWAAVTGSLSWGALSLVAVIFFWTPPHFWALSLWRSQDYARAGVPMLPVVRGKTVTRQHIFAYSLVLLPVGVLPALMGVGGPLYAATALLFGGWMAAEAHRVLREKDVVKEPAARRLFVVSIAYVFVLFAVLMAERGLGVTAFGSGRFGAWM